MSDFTKKYLPYVFGHQVGQSIDVPQLEKCYQHSIENQGSPRQPELEERILKSLLTEKPDHFLKFMAKEFHALVEEFQSQNHQEISQSKIYENIFKMFHYFQFLNEDLKKTIQKHFSTEYNFYRHALSFDPIGKSGLKQLWNFQNSNDHRPKIFVIFRKDRRYPGRLVMKDSSGNWVKNPSGQIWSIPVLGLSSLGLSFYHSYGQTPCGIYKIQGVMPQADQTLEYGNYRRLKIEFLSRENEGIGLKTRDDLEKSYLWYHPHLPEAMMKSNRSWWHQANLADALGRKYLRIHGTNRKNSLRDRFRPFHPFYPTTGCIATLEYNAFGIKQIHHQRLLLDQLMMAQNLPVAYENETQIQAMLYVCELDDRKFSVRLKDLF